MSLAGGNRSFRRVPGLAVTSQGQMLETETAACSAKGWQKSRRRTSSRPRPRARSVLPLAIEYGLTTRFEIMVEQVPYTAIRPKNTRSATGVGDLEATLTCLIRLESNRIPALALSAATNRPR